MTILTIASFRPEIEINGGKTREPPHGELMDMFLDPPVIGTGLGRTLWDHAIKSARERGFQSLTFESDPHAEPFYLRMGAKHVGEHEVAPGRVLPVMKTVLVVES